MSQYSVIILDEALVGLHFADFKGPRANFVDRHSLWSPEGGAPEAAGVEMFGDVGGLDLQRLSFLEFLCMPQSKASLSRSQE